MKGLINILATVMIFLSIGINSAQAQFVGTFWVLPIDEDFPVGMKVINIDEYHAEQMLLYTPTTKLNSSFIVNNTTNRTRVDLEFKTTIGADQGCYVYEGKEGNRVHVFFCRPKDYQGESPLNKIFYSYYDIPDPQKEMKEMLDAAIKQGIDNKQ